MNKEIENIMKAFDKYLESGERINYVQTGGWRGTTHAYILTDRRFVSFCMKAFLQGEGIEEFVNLSDITEFNFSRIFRSKQDMRWGQNARQGFALFMRGKAEPIYFDSGSDPNSHKEIQIFDSKEPNSTYEYSGMGRRICQEAGIEFMPPKFIHDPNGGVNLYYWGYIRRKGEKYKISEAVWPERCVACYGELTSYEMDEFKDFRVAYCIDCYERRFKQSKENRAIRYSSFHPEGTEYYIGVWFENETYAREFIRINFEGQEVIGFR